ncbi:hypothetical protein EVAR_24375_1 [Eumeta japonica]|uniref:Uncharacterized protein n=1 Tax=Eumeta variegata TaxID=151549 RepID=A0A4C1YBW6_EUMVA|nr:hypothetical protein EVAR_24375_1 [Eumeta japonica]
MADDDRDFLRTLTAEAREPPSRHITFMIVRKWCRVPTNAVRRLANGGRTGEAVEGSRVSFSHFGQWRSTSCERGPRRGRRDFVCAYKVTTLPDRGQTKRRVIALAAYGLSESSGGPLLPPHPTPPSIAPITHHPIPPSNDLTSHSIRYPIRTQEPRDAPFTPLRYGGQSCQILPICYSQYRKQGYIDNDRAVNKRLSLLAHRCGRPVT